MEGTPTVRKEEWINFEPSNQAPDPFVPTAPYCIRWTGKLRPPVTGNYVIRFEAERGGRLYLDGQKVTDVWESHHDGCDTVAIRLEGGRDYNLKAEFQNIRD